MKPTNPRPKYSRKTYLTMLLLPWALLIACLILDLFIILTALSSPDASYIETVRQIADVVAVVVTLTIFAVVILSPFAVYGLVKVDRSEGRKTKSVAILLTVFFSYFGLIYTYRKDSTKFWINFALTIVTAGFWGSIGWIWAIVITANRDKTFYESYYTQSSTPPAPAAPQSPIG